MILMATRCSELSVGAIGQVHDAHSAAAELSDDSIGADAIRHGVLEHVGDRRKL